jgi:hypothetical protein
MVFRVANDRDLAAESAHGLAFGHRLFRVISSLSMKVGADIVDQILDRWLVKDRDGIDTSEGSDDLGPFVLGHVWPAITFEAADLTVGIYRDDKKSAKLLGAFQIPHMPDMEQIETAVGENDLYSGFA